MLIVGKLLLEVRVHRLKLKHFIALYAWVVMQKDCFAAPKYHVKHQYVLAITCAALRWAMHMYILRIIYGWRQYQEYSCYPKIIGLTEAKVETWNQHSKLRIHTIAIFLTMCIYMRCNKNDMEIHDANHNGTILQTNTKSLANIKLSKSFT